METLRKKFNRKSAPMLYARDRETGQIIGLEGDRTPNVDWYHEDLHKNKLVCLCCNSPVHFNKGSDVKNGSRDWGLRPHFKINPGASHEDGCQQAKSSYRNETITNGFRFNFNTSSADYFRPKEGKIPGNLESISLKSMQDQANFMRLNDIEKMRNGWSVFREHESPWHNYMLSDADPACKKHLIDTVSMMARTGKKFQLASLELHVDKDKIEHPFRQPMKTVVKGKSIVVNEKDANGIKHIILPRYSFETQPLSHDPIYEELSELVEGGGTFMGQGLGELAILRRGNVKFYLFEIRITKPEQLIRENLDNLLKENRLHQLKKQELAIRLG